ncbi:MAG: hypothetical protein ACTSQA_09335 [Candidatus Heimdallarchaeaceae archaeon]
MSDKEKLLRNAEDGVKLYNQLKFDVAADGFKIVDKQIMSPEPTCVFCSATRSQGKDIVGAKVNDNMGKVQTIASLCENCAKRLNNLGHEDVEDSYVQKMIRFFFESNADQIINGQFAEKRMNKYPSIYCEYWALIKWTVEEKLLRQLIGAVPFEDSDGYTEVRCGDCCSCTSNEVAYDSSGISDVSHSITLYSPIRECWMNLEVCLACKKQINLDLNDMEHEIRTTYYDDYNDYADKPRRESLEIMCKATHGMKNKVLFLETATKTECVVNILQACGVDEDHQIVKKMQVAEEQTAEPVKEQDVQTSKKC